MQIKPLTKRLFNKENVRQVVREWLEEQKSKDLGDKKRLTEEIIEHNIEWFETLFMKSLKYFILDIKSFSISTICYKNILENKEDKLTEEYISILQKSVKNLFLGEINTREHKLNLKFESYLCTKTIEGLFYKGEVYKCFDFRTEKGIYGYKVDLEGKKIEGRIFNLVPQEANRHLVLDMNNFIKV